MLTGTKYTSIVLMAVLFFLTGFAYKNELKVYDTDSFTINLPASMRQVTKAEMPSVYDKNSLTYIFVESNKSRKKSILLVISMDKIKKPVPKFLKGTALKEISKGIQVVAASDSKCRSHTTELMEKQLSGQNSYYFERRSENCVVTLERYWTTIHGNHAFSIYLARPGKSDDEIARKVVDEISKIKLKINK
jgi:hypothetical protein